MSTHTIKFEIPVNDKDFQEIKGKIPNRLYWELETRRECAIMNEVMKSEGENIFEKINNTILRNEKSNNNLRRYKLKYKY